MIACDRGSCFMKHRAIDELPAEHLAQALHSIVQF